MSQHRRCHRAGGPTRVLRRPRCSTRGEARSMRVFVAGATGALGRCLLPMLIKAGHTVFGMTRSPDKASLIRTAGANPVVADALDHAAVMLAMLRASPEVVVHELTALSAFGNLRRFDREFAATNRLHTEGTRYLLQAAH